MLRNFCKIFQTISAFESTASWQKIDSRVNSYKAPMSVNVPINFNILTSLRFVLHALQKPLASPIRLKDSKNPPRYFNTERIFFRIPETSNRFDEFSTFEEKDADKHKSKQASRVKYLKFHGGLKILSTNFSFESSPPPRRPLFDKRGSTFSSNLKRKN